MQQAGTAQSAKNSGIRILAARVIRSRFSASSCGLCVIQESVQLLSNHLHRQQSAGDSSQPCLGLWGRLFRDYRAANIAEVGGHRVPSNNSGSGPVSVRGGELQVGGGRNTEGLDRPAQLATGQITLHHDHCVAALVGDEDEATAGVKGEFTRLLASDRMA